ncbi:radical SAM protein [Bacillus sp. SM2101]|uniref:radical SAM protein n=1 Tax=Bacillus sp. SM2101 TaxID=2805366 RepID=UPI001BDF50F3|nr:radical SAM protein [Bacillus sp. SM2101]
MNNAVSVKPIPSFYGFKVGVDENYRVASENKLLRLGVKVNTPETCNWACPYCYVGNPDAKDRPRILKPEGVDDYNPYKDKDWAEKMKGWIAQGMEEGVRAVTINGTFEPTTSPDYLEILEYCQSNGVQVTLVTNGGFLTDELIKKLYDLGVSLLTKINVPLVEEDDTQYEEFVGIQKVLSGKLGDEKEIYEYQKNLIYRLMEAGFNTSPSEGQTRLGVESVIAANNLPYLPDLIAQLRSWNIYSHIEIIKDQGFAKNQQFLQVSKHQIADFFEEVRKQDVTNGYEDWSPKPPYVAGVCYQNLIRVDLHANGEVKPCPGVETILGNLNDKSLKDILKDKNLNIVRNLETYIEGDCSDCELFKTRECYGGCRGTVYQTLKTHGYSEYECLVASDPSCWRVKTILNDGTSSDLFK